MINISTPPPAATLQNFPILGANHGYRSVTVLATVKLSVISTLTNQGLGQKLDAISDLLRGTAFTLELISSEFETMPVKGTAAYNIVKQNGLEAAYEGILQVPEDFGEIGAIVVVCEHQKEMYLKDIVLDGLPGGTVRINCDSWIQSKSVDPEERVFFAHKSYLPEQTPSPLKKLREEELENLRGDGTGIRKASDRVYDYDTYNDLGDPDTKFELHRPVLGNKTHPYPRRCRTGRPPCITDPNSETRAALKVYVPRDEDFEDLKLASFGINVLQNVLSGLIPNLESIMDPSQGFSSMQEIINLYRTGVQLPDMQNPLDILQLVPNLIQIVSNALKFPKPDVLDRDEFCWFRDEEFARQTLAGLNPYAIKLVTEWPLLSKLDPKIYGPPESAITSELIEQEIKGYSMSIEKALVEKKLFMLDYHDMLLPFVNKVREIEGTTLYGSRTLFFLTPQGTLKTLAIELTRPPSDDGKKQQWKQVFTPFGDGNATKTWLWRIAKAHVLAHDSGYHQLVSHWVRTHCCTEPYIIATQRQLSAVHPINRLLNPYFRYTMEINALARKSLINANGVIESSFFSDKYSMELSSVAYGLEWRFDHEALPADLISRGMAVEDPSAPHGLKLAIEDYPFANDGLILWDTLKQWVTDYVNHYYPEEALVKSDQELQAWWDEIRNKGHVDKKDEKWWPALKRPNDLIYILTTIIWVSSGHHAAVNFGQYAYAGYMPNRPTAARLNMPTEDPTDQEWDNFLMDPTARLLDTFPSKRQAVKVMAVLSTLSSHSPDEEYIGDQLEPSWAYNSLVKLAFESFNARLKKLEKIVDQRNADPNLKNRHGAGIMPYELLKPYSKKSGVTGMGVPNSISI